MAGMVLLAAAAASQAAAPPAKLKLGEAVYARCAACHSLAQDRTGPRHCGLFGRRAGSVAGFDYSEAMKRSGIVWNARTLDRFLADPPKALPGTNMTYAGVPDRTERAALIAYLEAANGGAQCRGLKATAGAESPPRAPPPDAPRSRPIPAAPAGIR